MQHLKKIIGAGAVLLASAAVAVPLAAVNATYQQQADDMQSKTSEWVGYEKTVSSDTKMNALYDKIKLGSELQYVSLTEQLKSNISDLSPFPSVISALPGTKAMVAATEAYDEATKRGIDNKVTAKIAALKEAKHLCELLGSGSLNDFASNPDNMAFLSGKNMSTNLPYYLEYCGVGGANKTVDKSA